MLQALLIFGDDYVTSDGTGERDYIHISDLMEGHFKAFNKLEELDAYSEFNLGTGRSVSVLELIKSFEKVNNVEIPFKISARRNGDVAKSYADPKNANSILQWNSICNLEKMCFDAWEPIKNES